MVRAQATAKYVRTSSQKAGLVLDLIRGKDINRALSALQFSRKAVARDIAKVLRSAVANAQQQDGFGGEVERLFVSKAHADNGPSMKRVRPAPMGRAFRIIKRTTHLTIEVTERPQVIKAVAADDTARPKRAKKTSPNTKAAKAAKGTKARKAAQE
ncbi:MAG TPA: 50S ribosomal protein L22 [Vicinamibacterales bacterium]|nr:50S ribosomal protein L22 [Vicinamibacterales bacterium]